MRYSIDTSAIIECWWRQYPPEVFHTVWIKLENLIEKNIIIAIDDVLFELEKKEDAIYKWALERRNMFLPHDVRIELAGKSIIQNYKRLIDERNIRSGADPWVIALAKVESYAVITDEKPTGNLNKPNIPDVCYALNIPCINMLQLFKEQKWKF